jgi:hypothetical protein
VQGAVDCSLVKWTFPFNLPVLCAKQNWIMQNLDGRGGKLLDLLQDTFSSLVHQYMTSFTFYSNFDQQYLLTQLVK